MDVRGEEFELRRRLLAADIACFDFDQCLFAFFIQTLVAAGVMGRSIVSPKMWRHVWPLLVGGVSLGLLRLHHGLRRHRVPNRVMLELFAHSMQGVPVTMIRDVVRRSYRFFDLHALECARLFSQRMTTGILTESISPIAAQVAEDFPVFSFAIGNEIEEVDGTFKGYRTMFCSGDDKLRILQNHMIVNRLRGPVILGHSMDEAPLARWAMENNGLTIGINPDPEVRDLFDIVVEHSRWMDLARWLRMALSDPSESR